LGLSEASGGGALGLVRVPVDARRL